MSERASPKAPVCLYPALSIGDLMREVRARTGLSQRALAAAANVPLSTVARWESDVVPGARLGTVQTVLSAAGFQLAVVDGHGEVVRPKASVPEALDDARRHLPAHLPIRRVVKPSDYWGWMHHLSCYFSPPLPDWTYVAGPRWDSPPSPRPDRASDEPSSGEPPRTGDEA